MDSKLFSPIRLLGLTVSNRIVVAPMCQYSPEDGKAAAPLDGGGQPLSVSGTAL